MRKPAGTCPVGGRLAAEWLRGPSSEPLRRGKGPFRIPKVDVMRTRRRSAGDLHGHLCNLLGHGVLQKSNARVYSYLSDLVRSRGTERDTRPVNSATAQRPAQSYCARFRSGVAASADRRGSVDISANTLIVVDSSLVADEPLRVHSLCHVCCQHRSSQTRPQARSRPPPPPRHRFRLRRGL